MKLGFGLGLSNTTGSAAAFSPLDLEPLALYNVQDLGTLWQDAAGTIPATTAGQTVMRIDDLSGNGLHMVSDTGAPLVLDDFGFYRIDVDGPADKFYVIVPEPADWPVMGVAGWSTKDDNSHHFAIRAAKDKFITLRQHTSTGLTVGKVDWDASVTLVSLLGIERGHVVLVADLYADKVTCNGIEIAHDYTADPYKAMPTGETWTLSLGGHDQVGPTSQGSSFYAAIMLDRAVTDTERSDLNGWLESKCPVERIKGAAVFSTIGQSNMAGRGTDTGAIDYPATAFEWTDDEGCIAADHPLQHYNVASNPGTMGLQAGFAAEWAADGRGDLIFIASAAGGTGFDNNQWAPGEPMYVIAQNEANDFYKLYGAPLAGFLWHQGGADVDSTATYEASLHGMIAGLREDCDGASDVPGSETPFILGEIPNKTVNGDIINGIINDTPTNVARTAVAMASDLTTFDTLHFDEASLITLGGRYYDEFVPFG